MDTDHDSGHSSYGETAVLVRELDALKRQGCNLLVLGPSTGRSTGPSCSDFLGDDSVSPRRRLFVFTESDYDIRSRLPTPTGRIGPDRHQIIHFESVGRSAAATAPPPSGPDVIPVKRISSGSVRELGLAISAAIEEFEQSVPDTLDPAVFRMCFDELTPILADYGEEITFRFLHLVTNRVRSVNGMAHYHLPIRDSDRLVSTFSPLFDAVIEISVRDGGVKQRWTLRDGDIQTDWLSI